MPGPKAPFRWTLILLALSGLILVFGGLKRALSASGEGTELASSLDIPLDRTAEKRKAFREEIVKLKSWADVRSLYEENIDLIGANGIIHEVEDFRPTCHGAGHPMGMVIYSRLQKIGPALKACRDACNSGCMHGVFMEAFAPGHQHVHGQGTALEEKQQVLLASLKSKVPTLCTEENLVGMYKPGDCAHGVGHAVIHILDYDIPASMEQCRLFRLYAMEYYCATGAYMQYVNSHDARDSKNRPLFYPCDSNEYPAACFRYKMVHVFRRLYQGGGRLETIAKKCLELAEKYQWGCFHGIGNANMGILASGRRTFSDICGFGSGEDQYACIDGVMERLGKFHSQVVDVRCRVLEGWKKDLCLASGHRGMYALNKSFQYYVR